MNTSNSMSIKDTSLEVENHNPEDIKETFIKQVRKSNESESTTSHDEEESDAEGSDTKFHFDSYSRSLQKWIGHIVKINDDYFTAKLVDITAGGTNEYAEIELDQVSPDDRGLVKVGAVFYWNIFENFYRGRKQNNSEIHFQRLNKLKQDELDTIFDQAEEIAKKWSNNEQSEPGT